MATVLFWQVIAVVILCKAIFATPQASNHNSKLLQIGKVIDGKLILTSSDEFEEILNVSNIMDRQLVVVSMTGRLDIGKSFLMNLFIQYLEAKVLTKFSRHSEQRNLLIRKKNVFEI